MLHDAKRPLPVRPDLVVDDGMPAAVPPGLGPELLDHILAGARALEQISAATHQLSEDQLAQLTAAAVRLNVRGAQVAAVATADAITRGTIAGSDAANTTQWITAQAAEAGVVVEPREVKTIAVIADACTERKNTVIASATARGGCTLAAARVALSNADKIRAVLPTADRDEILGWFLQLDPSLGARGAHALTRQLLARYDAEALSAEDAHLERVETLSFGVTPTGMTRMIAELSPTNAAIVKAAIMAGSAPNPATETTENGSVVRVLDDRTPGKRRVDALMDLIHAGARAGANLSGAAVGSAATVLVTMNLDTLTSGAGAATTPVGDVLDAGAARRAACDADLIPVVLGGPSQPVDVGRRERLVTKGLRAAVVIRDHGCTFPGCDRPPGFCEIHHVIPWWAGGHTSLANSAMLCRRHHQTVHRHGYTATTTASGVVWDLTPGRMHHHAAA